MIHISVVQRAGQLEQLVGTAGPDTIRYDGTVRPRWAFVSSLTYFFNMGFGIRISFLFFFELIGFYFIFFLVYYLVKVDIRMSSDHTWARLGYRYHPICSLCSLAMMIIGHLI